MNTTFTQTQIAQKAGTYNPTSIDTKKNEVDFLIKDSNYIQWKGGALQFVSKRDLAKLQSQFTWMTDF